MKNFFPVYNNLSHGGSPEDREAFAKAHPARYALAKGQPANSVLWRDAPEFPFQYAEMVERGDYIPHPSGRFVRP